jgi:AcrR family transcriptional regulator
MKSVASDTREPSTPGLSAKGAQMRAEILIAARRVLVDEGSNALTTRRVARELGIGISHVQYYFSSNEQIVQAILEEHLGRAHKRIVGDDQNSRQHSALAIVLKDQKSKESCRIFWELWALTGRGGEVGRLMHDFHVEYVAAVTPYVQGMNPLLTPDQARVRAVLIAALLEGLSLFRGHGRKPLLPATQLDPAIYDAIQALAQCDAAVPGPPASA